jgi:hypothetical protein
VNINGGLTEPFKYEKGPLFTITIEPFLLLCNHNLRDYGLKIPPSISRTLVTSAYANDVTVFITKDEGFPLSLQNFVVYYGAISGATLNIHKSNGLLAGRWRKRTDRPLGFHWKEQGG